MKISRNDAAAAIPCACAVCPTAVRQGSEAAIYESSMLGFVLMPSFAFSFLTLMLEVSES